MNIKIQVRRELLLNRLRHLLKAADNKYTQKNLIISVANQRLIICGQDLAPIEVAHKFNHFFESHVSLQQLHRLHKHLELSTEEVMKLDFWPHRIILLLEIE